MESALDDKHDLHVRSQIFECLREILYTHDLKCLQSTRSETKMKKYYFFVRKRLLSIDLLMACGGWGHVLAARVSPVLVPNTNTGHDCPWLPV